MPKYYTDSFKLDKEFKDLDSTSKNNETYEKLMHTSNHIVDVGLNLPPDYELRRFDISTGLFVVALLYNKSKEIAYYVKVQQWDAVTFNDAPVTQVLLWKTLNIKHEDVVYRLPEIVFLKYLLVKYNLVISDSNQTIQGAYFWFRMISKLFQKGASIAQYNILDGTIFEVDDLERLRNNEYDTWGNSDEYQYKLLVIRQGNNNETI